MNELLKINLLWNYTFLTHRFHGTNFRYLLGRSWKYIVVLTKVFFDFRPKFWFLTKIFNKYYSDFLPKSWKHPFWTNIFNIPIFYLNLENIDFWPKFWKFLFLTKISIFEQNFDIWTKFWKFWKNIIKNFVQTSKIFDFWQQFFKTQNFLSKIKNFGQKSKILIKNRSKNFDFWPMFSTKISIPRHVNYFQLLPGLAEK